MMCLNPVQYSVVYNVHILNICLNFIEQFRGALVDALAWGGGGGMLTQCL
jgi:hypothetical protein